MSQDTGVAMLFVSPLGFSALLAHILVSRAYSIVAHAGLISILLTRYGFFLPRMLLRLSMVGRKQKLPCTLVFMELLRYFSGITLEKQLLI